MRTFLLATSLILITVGCKTTAPSFNEVAQITKVKNTIDRFYKNINKQHLQDSKKVFAEDTSLIFLGTHDGEFFKGTKAVHNMIENALAFKEKANVTVAIKEQYITIHRSGMVAWFSQVTDWRIDIKGNIIFLKDLRVSGVLEKKKDEWLFVQYHSSLPEKRK